jgi:hypothetical protein
MMAATITQSVNDTAKTIEDKVRALAANQGKNDNAMWLLIDTEIAQSTTDGKIKGSDGVSKHGNK